MSDTTLTTSPDNSVTQNESRGYRPQVDIYETEDQFVVVADVPGTSEEDIELSIEKDVLSLHAKVTEPQFEGFESRWRGYGVGDWKRSFRLTETIDREGVDATVKDGVLRITLPKAKEALKKSIPVKRLD
jgi:HSP20 family molecular chaperone IbpA